MPNLNLAISDIMYGETPVLKIMKGDTQKWPIPYEEQYLTFKALESGTFQCTRAANYSINGGAWTALAAATDTPELEAGDTIRWKATNSPNSTNGVGKFSSTGKFKVYGNPLSMRNGDNFITSTTRGNYCFYVMFNSCVGLVDASKLVINSANAQYHCASMFTGCTNLKTAPELPAKTLGSLCYYNMFANCTSLTIAPSILPATTLASTCYSSMFSGCSSLETAPVLPALSFANGCYGNMFKNCSSLNYIKAMFTASPSTSYLSNWVSGVAVSGTFVKNSAATWNTTYGASAVPSGWTVVTADA